MKEENIGVLSAGERFSFKGFEWIVLDNNVDGGVLAIMASAWNNEEYSFDDDGCNNYARAKQGYMTKEEVDRCYESWKAHVGNESSKKKKSPGRRARRNCHNLIICMDQYYKNLWRESKCLDLSVQENSL